MTSVPEGIAPGSSFDRGGLRQPAPRRAGLPGSAGIFKANRGGAITPNREVSPRERSQGMAEFEQAFPVDAITGELARDPRRVEKIMSGRKSL